jgi:CDP-glycerol glycerophosphotransferase (TagB/SpsB family)
MDDYEFKELIYLAKTGDINAVEKVLEMFRPCINKNSFINEEFNEDIIQELNIELIRCIKKFTYTEFQDIWNIGVESYFEN